MFDNVTLFTSILRVAAAGMLARNMGPTDYYAAGAIKGLLSPPLQLPQALPRFGRHRRRQLQLAGK